MEYNALNGTPWLHGTFWVFIAVAVFAWFFGRKIWAAIAGMLDHRTATVRAALDEAATLKAEAEAMLRDARAKRDAALEDARHIVASAEAEARRMAAELAAEAEATAARRERMAMDRIAAAEAAAVNEVRGAAADIAAAAVGEVLRADLDAARDGALIDRAIAALPGALAGKAA